MKIRYTNRALNDLNEVVAYLEERSTTGANNVAQRLSDLLELVRHQPLSGQLSRTRRVRRDVAAPFPYIVYYRIEADYILIVGLRHTSRLVPKSWR